MKKTTEEAVPKKRGAHRNRKAGHKYELDIAKDLHAIGFEHVVTCRSESRSRDDQKIDLINKDEATVGRLPYNIQCKNSCSIPNYVQILKTGHTITVKGKKKTVKPLPKVPGVVNVIIHKATAKSAGGLFVPKGEFAIMSKEDFLEMVRDVEIARAEIRRLKALQEFINKRRPDTITCPDGTKSTL